MPSGCDSFRRNRVAPIDTSRIAPRSKGRHFAESHRRFADPNLIYPSSRGIRKGRETKELSIAARRGEMIWSGGFGEWMYHFWQLPRR